jgi:hypothetical protein
MEGMGLMIETGIIGKEEMIVIDADTAKLYYKYNDK